MLQSVPIDRPDGTNVILGQAHFIESVEDLHEASVNAVPRIAFVLAICEASGPLSRANKRDRRGPGGIGRAQSSAAGVPPDDRL
jgi:adenosine/AMP kinase